MPRSRESELIIQNSQLRADKKALKEKISQQVFEIRGLKAKLYAEKHYAQVLDTEIGRLRDQQIRQDIRATRRGRPPSAEPVASDGG